MIQSIKNLFSPAFKRTVRKLLYKGNTYVCQFCNYSGRSLKMLGHDFLVLSERQIIGGGKRPGVCYDCLSIDRERHVFLYLKHKTPIYQKPEAIKILHIAPEMPISETLRKLNLQ